MPAFYTGQPMPHHPGINNQADVNQYLSAICRRPKSLALKPYRSMAVVWLPIQCDIGVTSVAHCSPVLAETQDAVAAQARSHLGSRPTSSLGLPWQGQTALEMPCCPRCYCPTHVLKVEGCRTLEDQLACYIPICSSQFGEYRMHHMFSRHAML